MCNFFYIYGITCTYFRIIIHFNAYQYLQITWLSYFGSENQGLPLRSWFVTCWLWRHIPIVTSLAVPSSCVVTQTPMGTNSGTRRRKRKFPLLFVNCDRGRIEIDHLYGLRCRGWYCNPEQLELCRPSRGRSRSIPIISFDKSYSNTTITHGIYLYAQLWQTFDKRHWMTSSLSVYIL